MSRPGLSMWGKEGEPMTPQERAAAPVEVRQALADKVKNLIISNLTHEENQLWLANVDAFEERAYQRGRQAALLEARKAVVSEYLQDPVEDDLGDIAYDHAIRDAVEAIDRLAQEGS